MKYIRITIVIMVLIVFSQTVKATNLRGRVIHFDPAYNNYVPVPNVRVDIWVFNGYQWVDASYAITGADGMYYFLNMAPGVNFKVQVNGNFYPPQPLFLANVQVLDIPQIVI